MNGSVEIGTAVDVEALPRNGARQIGRKKYRDIGNLVRTGNSVQRRVSRNLLFDIGGSNPPRCGYRRKIALKRFSLDLPGRNAIHADIVGAELKGERLGHAQ